MEIAESAEVWRRLESGAQGDDAVHWVRVHAELERMLERLVQAALAEEADRRRTFAASWQPSAAGSHTGAGS